MPSVPWSKEVAAEPVGAAAASVAVGSECLHRDMPVLWLPDGRWQPVRGGKPFDMPHLPCDGWFPELVASSDCESVQALESWLKVVFFACLV